MLLAVKKSKMFLKKYDCFGVYVQLFATLAGSGVVFLTFYENGGKLQKLDLKMINMIILALVFFPLTKILFLLFLVFNPQLRLELREYMPNCAAGLACKVAQDAREFKNCFTESPS